MRSNWIADTLMGRTGGIKRNVNLDIRYLKSALPHLDNIVKQEGTYIFQICTNRRD
ncbi:hypothetical protein E1B28_006271 [Marasmius oreades]|uniref:Uncharacterized protein n=1 Tax=Marasmius oreades TaxID=181124 RepID=A0A9P7S502_9AGAR|nr:uncharacterized protein E1B28_006271 [Marasmius oreades]KAG7095534.1 hypothetical protein E1B28_006271 [Marasmius oreades]